MKNGRQNRRAKFLRVLCSCLFCGVSSFISSAPLHPNVCVAAHFLKTFISHPKFIEILLTYNIEFDTYVYSEMITTIFL